MRKDHPGAQKRRGSDRTNGARTSHGGQRRQQGPSPGTSLPERVTFFASLLVVVGLFAFVSYQQVAGQQRPAIVEVQPLVDEVRQEAEAYYLPVRLKNQGDMAAEDVHVRLVLAAPQGEREIGELVIPFLPGRATARGTVVFRTTPTWSNLRVDGLSFLEP